MTTDIDSFEITAFDLGLLGRLNFGWSGSVGTGDGALAVDRGRPYGSTDVLADLREIYAESMGYELLTDETGTLSSFVFPDGQVVDAEEFDQILWSHDRNMVTVLKIMLNNPRPKGSYIQTRKGSWERAMDPA